MRVPFKCIFVAPEVWVLVVLAAFFVRKVRQITCTKGENEYEAGYLS